VKRGARVVIPHLGKSDKLVKYCNFLAVELVASLARCGQAGQDGRSKPGSVRSVASRESASADGERGVISSLDGRILTLNHNGASAAGLKPGRHRFIVHIDVLAEAPITPGARVKFQFKKAPTGLEVSRPEPRP
jgi:hypothetical protein